MPNTADIEAAVALAEAATAVPGGKSKFRVCTKSTPIKKARRWTSEEEDFLRQNHARLSLDEMAQHLNRSALGVRLHILREMHLRACSTVESVITAEQIAWGLGADGKTIHRLIDTGLMPGRRAPTIARNIRVVDKIILLKWLLDPMHWIYFKPRRVGTLSRRCNRCPSKYYDFTFWEDAGKLVLAASKKWKDQWLTPGQVWRRLGRRGTYARYVNKAIRKGTLRATKWGNWWILKNDLPGSRETLNFRGDVVDR